MKVLKPLIGLFLASTLFACASHQVQSDHSPAHWTYADTGNWGDLSADFHMCAEGLNQSPIDLSSDINATLPELVFDYYSSPMRQVNNGHTIQQNIEPGSFLRVPARNKAYELKQFHFHSPSEHLIQGESFPMEIHFVHADRNGALAVVGVMVKAGKENAELAKLWAFMPEHEGDSAEHAVGIEETNLLPPTGEYYYYSGSLTTPPCSEGVAWAVLKTPIEASNAQIALFKSRMGQPTNRPVQAHNARMVLD